MNKLKPSIRDKIWLQPMWSVDEVHNLTWKAEMLEKMSGRSEYTRRSSSEVNQAISGKGKAPQTHHYRILVALRIQIHPRPQPNGRASVPNTH
jgi:hypothetical protein